MSDFEVITRGAELILKVSEHDSVEGRTLRSEYRMTPDQGRHLRKDLTIGLIAARLAERAADAERLKRLTAQLKETEEKTAKIRGELARLRGARP